MEESEIIRILLLKKKLLCIIKDIDSIMLELNIINRTNRALEIERINNNVFDIDFALDEMLKKIQKEI